MSVINQTHGTNFALWNGDCVEVIRDVPDASVGLSVFSPPFASLYTFSDDDRDMGNCADGGEFAKHFRFLIPEILRVTMAGRLCAVHCMNLTTTIGRDGVIGLRDFRGEIIRAFVELGWIYHSEVCIWKDPVQAMQRTKALGLLHKTIRNDSSQSRQGLPDYVVVFRKPGKNPEPIAHGEDFPVQMWQRYASPIWASIGDNDGYGMRLMGAEPTPGDDSSGINPGDTLQHRSAREHDDERHIRPLQLDVTRRCVKLWSNPGDVVLSPFAGIGSEGHVAIEMGRKFIGIELKPSYYRQAAANLNAIETATSQPRLFG